MAPAGKAELAADPGSCFPAGTTQKCTPHTNKRVAVPGEGGEFRYSARGVEEETLPYTGNQMFY